MTAFDLIDSIFARVQPSMPGNVRRITEAQLKYLRDLIDADPEGSQVKRGAPGSLVWSPSGRTKYVITEDPTGGEKHTLAKFSGFQPQPHRDLFDL